MSARAYNEAIKYLRDYVLPDEIRNAHDEGRPDLATAYRRIDVQLAHECGRKRRKMKRGRRRMKR